MNPIRQVVAGEGKYGSIIRLLNGAESIQPMLRLLDNADSSFRQIGHGAYRDTYSIHGVPEVLKAATVPAGIEMNRDDWRLGTDRSVRGAFTRAFAHHPEYMWVILERVSPIGIMWEHVPNAVFTDRFPPMKRGSAELGIDPQYLFRQAVYIASGQATMGIRMLGRRVMGDELESMTQECLRIPNFSALIRAVRKYTIRISEVCPNNLGIAQDGRLVLLDSSVDARIHSSSSSEYT